MKHAKNGTSENIETEREIKFTLISGGLVSGDIQLMIEKADRKREKKREEMVY